MDECYKKIQLDFIAHPREQPFRIHLFGFICVFKSKKSLSVVEYL
uniref:Uncharacterized protein n=1 Tax=Arundo donax TaxID=35708 RepID=A0A0A9H3R8_ARUDO